MEQSAKIINTTTITLAIPSPLKKAAQKNCGNKGESLSAYIRRLMRDDLQSKGVSVIIQSKVV
jgi:hypothetical protein